MKPSYTRRFYVSLKTVSLIVACSLANCQALGTGRAGGNHKDALTLPPADTREGMPLNKALSMRRSVRRFNRRDLTSAEIGQLLWAGQGKTSPHGFRTAPSAGALYPLEVHVLTASGVFQYDPNNHQANLLAAGDKRNDLARASLGQDCVANAAASFVVAGVVSRTWSKYGDRAERYVVFEAGAAVQNMLLEAVNLNLGAVVVGAYQDAAVSRIAALPKGSVPLAIVAVGEPIF
jgi:SagB-type dehydrogenase family enzyme